MKLVFRVTSHQRLILVEDAVNQMKAFAQHKWWHTEAGGVLLGRHLLDSGDVVVDEVTMPQSTDCRSRFSFFRSSKHQALARERWQNQLNTMAYLGLWHTHPEVDPTPSGVDHRDWQQAVSRDEFEGERLYFPIIGTQRIRIWCLSRHGSIRELQEDIRNG
ncbi:Mov34/MPN/PAD-1 family protein [Pseudomonas lalucatii]|nr:Mov34/MPN/PAD-1 family protein [Pseudomonas lalucatii]